MSKLLSLTNSTNKAIVDDEDYERLSKYTWRAGGYRKKYVIRKRLKEDGVGASQIFLHNTIAPPPKGFTWDHINQNPLDNRKSNLRAATPRQQCANTPRKKNQVNAKSKYRGITPDGKRWRAQAMVDGVRTHIGTFDTEEEAAKAYDTIAKEQYGEFANLNFKE